MAEKTCDGIHPSRSAQCTRQVAKSQIARKRGSEEHTWFLEASFKRSNEAVQAADPPRAKLLGSIARKTAGVVCDEVEEGAAG